MTNRFGIVCILILFNISWLTVRRQRISNLVKSSPELLVYRGQKLIAVMKKEELTGDVIYAVIKKNGLSSIEEAGAIVLETDGSLTLIKNVKSLQKETMNKVLLPKELASGEKEEPL